MGLRLEESPKNKTRKNTIGFVAILNKNTLPVLIYKN